jgi:hypothetical protein
VNRVLPGFSCFPGEAVADRGHAGNEEEASLNWIKYMVRNLPEPEIVSKLAQPFAAYLTEVARHERRLYGLPQCPCRLPVFRTHSR